MPEDTSRVQASPSISAGGAAVVHEDTTAKWFLISSIAYFFIVGIIAVTIAAKFVWPQLLGTVQYLTYGRLRPLHVNGMLFGWLLAADMGLAFYLIPRLCGVKLWSEKLGVATAALWNVIVLGAVVMLLMGYNQGLEYAELPTWEDVLVVIAWIMFGLNIFMTIASRKYDQMYVSIWYIMGTILWTAFVYLTGNFAVLFATGVNQANLNWMYVHNAVGLIFTPIGLALAYYYIPKVHRLRRISLIRPRRHAHRRHRSTRREDQPDHVGHFLRGHQPRRGRRPLRRTHQEPRLRVSRRDDGLAQTQPEQISRHARHPR